MTAEVTARTTSVSIPIKDSVQTVPNGKRKSPGAMTLIVGFGIVAICIAGVFLSPTPAVAGMWCIAMMVTLMFLSVPVGFALSLPSLIGLYGISGVPAMMNVLKVAPFSSVSHWSYSVLPMFIFMGMLLVQSGMTSKIYRATELWFGWLPGGIGIGTTAAGAGLSSVSGSTIGMTYALGRAGIPEMLRAGYDKRLAVGAVIVAGLPGALIPPSILLVIYAGIASVPVGPQLIAGAIPGIVVAVVFSLVILVIGVFSPRLIGRSKESTGDRPRVTWAERFKALGGVWGFPVIMLVLIGGMFSGIFTPTEAGAAAALTALLLTVVYSRGNKPLKKITAAAMGTVSATASIFFIIIGAELLTRLMATTGLANQLTETIVGLNFNRVTFLLCLVVGYIIMGMFFDTLSMMLLTVPILLPSFAVMDVSPLWFGVFVVFLGELAMLTPPVGILSYIVHSITKNPEVNLGQKITLGDIFVAVAWALPVCIIILVLMILFPGMAEWLPSLLE